MHVKVNCWRGSLDPESGILDLLGLDPKFRFWDSPGAGQLRLQGPFGDSSSRYGRFGPGTNPCIPISGVWQGFVPAFPAPSAD